MTNARSNGGVSEVRAMKVAAIGRRAKSVKLLGFGCIREGQRESDREREREIRRASQVGNRH